MFDSLVIGKIICRINISRYSVGEKLLQSSMLSAGNIKDILGQQIKIIKPSGLTVGDSCILDLGIISASQFGEQFNSRLAQAFTHFLLQQGENVISEWEEINAESRPTNLSAPSEKQGLYTLAISCLQQAGPPRYDKHQLPQLLRQLLASVGPPPVPAVFYRRATACRLALAALGYLLNNAQGQRFLANHYPTIDQLKSWEKAIAGGEIVPELLVQLMRSSLSAQQYEIARRWLLPLWHKKAVRDVVSHHAGKAAAVEVDAFFRPLLQVQAADRQPPSLWHKKAVRDVVSHHAGKAAAEEDDAFFRPLLQVQAGDRQPPSLWHKKAVRDVVSHHAGKAAAEEDDAFFRPLLQVQAADRQPPSLWHKKAVRDVVSHHAGKAAAVEDDAFFRPLLQVQAADRQPPQDIEVQRQHSQYVPPQQQPAYPVSNAGMVILWPLLPQLFSLLALCDEGEFISASARWQAVTSLDWLTWGEEPSASGRLQVCQLLCGISVDIPQPELPVLSLQQRQRIDTWLTAVSQQLPTWQKLSLSDIRQLFLQRPGEIVTDTEPAQVAVNPEAFDYLLGDWPWPLNLVSLPWLKQPLTLIWPLPYLTG